MSDYFTNEKLQLLTGLTKYKQEKVLVPVALTDGVWTPVLSISATDVHRVICAYQLTLSGDAVTDTLMRLVAIPAGGVLDDDAKVFPFADGIEFISGVSSDAINVPVQIPVGYDFELQVKVTGTGALAALDSLSVIEVPILNHV